MKKTMKTDTAAYFVYILECADKSLYVGSTNDLDKRVYQHNNAKSGAHYTKIRRPVTLRYREQFSTYREARAREAEIKRLKRAEKLHLIKAGVQKQDEGRGFLQPVILVLDNVRSIQNTASLFRIADCVGVQKIILAGITPGYFDRFQKPRADFAKISLGAEKNVSCEHVESTLSCIKKYKKNGFEIVALEQTKNSISYTDFKITKPTVLVLGAEVLGVSESVLRQCDVCIEISMAGDKESLNVAVAGAIALFRLRDTNH